MKSKLIGKPALLGFVFVGLMSCGTDGDDPGPASQLSVVQFVETELVIKESDGQKKLELNLNRPAQKDGSVSVILSSDQLTVFDTEPANSNGLIELPVAKGSTNVSFLLRPANDTEAEGGKALTARISGTSSGFRIGTRDSLFVSVSDDEEPLGSVEANFLTAESSISENATEGLMVTVKMSSATTVNGTVEIVHASEKLLYGTDFITEPAAENGKIILHVSSGSGDTGFKVIPINNQASRSDQRVLFTMSNAQGGVRLGQSVVMQLDIMDDESAPRIKGYETAGGGWRVKRVFEYDESNNLIKINWEQYTPAYLGGSYRYEYQQGRLYKMVENANRETYYIWEGDRIVKEEQYTNGALSKYVLYNYDPAGNIGEVALHYRQPDGSIKMGLLFVYLYFTDGNVYKKMAYNPGDGSGEYHLISTTTYDNYIDVVNPFPIEIVPNVSAQPKLPGSITEEGNGNHSVYNLSYEFDSSGKPSKRTAVSGNVSEVTTYRYQ